MRCKTRPPSAPLAEAAVRFRCEKLVVARSDLSAVAQRAKAERESDDAIQSSISPRRCRIVFELSLALLHAQGARQHDDLVMCC